MNFNFAIDLDGTLAEWGENHEVCGEWLPGAQKAVRELLEAGHRVVVHSCRATWEAGGGLKAVAEFLRSGGFVPYQVISPVLAAQEPVWVAMTDAHTHTFPTTLIDPLGVGIWRGLGKPIAHFYIDDRAVHFTGDWETTLAIAKVRMIQEGV